VLAVSAGPLCTGGARRRRIGERERELRFGIRVQRTSASRGAKGCRWPLAEAKVIFTGFQVTTTAGFRQDAVNPPPACLGELNFLNVPLQDSSPPTWVDENGNNHALAAPYFDPPWNWDSGGVGKTDNKPFYDEPGQKRNIRASQAGGRAGREFALDDLLKTATDADPTLALVFGDQPRTNDSIKFATLLASVDTTAKKISVIESFTWGASVSRQGGDVTVTTLPIVIFSGLPAGLGRARLQSALDASGFGADLTAPNGTLQHKGEGWTIAAAIDCSPCRPAPAPATLVLVASGLVALVLAHQRRRHPPARSVI
jgi:hypothetical protein